MFLNPGKEFADYEGGYALLHPLVNISQFQCLDLELSFLWVPKGLYPNFVFPTRLSPLRY